MRLGEYITARGITLTQAAKELRCPVSTVHRWINGGIPEVSAMRNITRWSNGAVMANDFYYEVQSHGSDKESNQASS